MNAHVKPETLRLLLKKTGQLRIVVIGDIMLDENIDGSVTRISPEAPVPILARERRTTMPGGAGNVACGVATLNAGCTLIGITGNDSASDELTSHFTSRYGDGFRSVFIQDTARPTTLKTRFWARSHGQVQQLFRVDSEVVSHPSDEVQQRLVGLISSLRPRPDPEGTDLIILSDYAKGVISSDVVTAALATGIPVVAAPKPGNCKVLPGVSVILPNLLEATAMARSFGYEGNDIIEIMKTIQLACAAGSRVPDIVVTRGKDGIIALSHDGVVNHEPTKAQEVYDVTGAGDTVLAVFSVCKAAGLSLFESISIANLAAGIKVGKVGAATVAIDEMIQTISI